MRPIDLEIKRAFNSGNILIRKMREIHRSRILGKKVYDLDNNDKLKAIESIKKIINIFED